MPARLVLAVVVLTIASCAVTVVADATMPGANGRIAFRRFDDAHGSSGIFSVAPDGSGERRLTRAPHGYVDDEPEWSPNGSRLAFTRCSTDIGACAVYTIRADGTGLVRLSAPCTALRKRPPPACEDDGNVAFSPDGARIVYEGANSSRGAPAGRRALYVVDVASGAERRITPWALDGGDDPDWSPDGRWILFRSHVDGGGVSNVCVVRPDGSGMRRLTHFTRTGDVLTSASFSPDGKWIVFGAGGLAGRSDLWVMRADGAHLHPITHTERRDGAPDWGPAW